MAATNSHTVIDPAKELRINTLRKMRLREPFKEEEFFWFKHDAGEYYLNNFKVPPDVREQLKRSKAFWAWFNHMWYFNDLKIFDNKQARENYTHDQFSKSTYWVMQTNLMSKYKVNRVLMNSIIT